MALTHTKEQITEDFLIQNDGRIAWISDSYLCMRGMADDGTTLDFLDHVAEVKQLARRNGVVFKQ